MIKRKTNFELLRIVSMIMIITLHFFTFGGIINDCFSEINFQNFVIYSLFVLCLTSVNLYVLITGYFMVDSKFKLSKLLKIEFEVVFYSIIIYLMLVLCGQETFSINHLLTDALPTIMSKYWFATGYIFLYLLTPILNKIIKSISKVSFKKLIILLFFIFVFVGNLNPSNRTLSLSNGYSLIWMIYVYLIGAYIRIYFDKDISSIKLLLIILTCLILKVFLYLTFKGYNSINLIQTIRNARFAYNNIFVFISSISIFLLFMKIEIKNNFLNKMILFFSCSTFAVYLIHTNSDFIPILWKYINPKQFYNTNFIYLYLILCDLLIFLICILFDKIRMIIFNFIGKLNYFQRFKAKIDEIKLI